MKRDHSPRIRRTVAPLRHSSARFRQHDLIRALRAARAAGLNVAGFELDPDTGRIIVKVTCSGKDEELITPLDQWLSEHASET